jgi:glucose-6-phosphate-specific signal transduction histidine kinase
VDLAAYRIIQEALTNVVKHAGTAARCVVAVTYTDADLVIRVTDNGGATAQLRGVSATAPTLPGTPAPSAAQASALALARASGAVPVGDGQPIAGGGHGIIGMRERVHLCGGEFSALPVPEGGFRVMAALPLPAVDSPVSQLRAGLGDFPPFDGTQLSGIRR